MEVTHSLKTSVQSVLENTTGFDIQVSCKSVFLSNTGDDDAKLYFNNIIDDYYFLKAGAVMSINSEQGEIVDDSIKIEFLSNNNPIINIVKQIKTMQ